MTINAYVEKIAHFICGSCSSWFSISEFNFKKIKRVTCPNCQKTFKIKKPKCDK